MSEQAAADHSTTIIVLPASAMRQVALAWLEQSTGERRYVQSEIRIGRGIENDVRVDDSSVSRYHAFVRRVDGRYLLSDLGSRNGTFVNDKQVGAPRQLSTGDRIRMGSTELTFHIEMVDATHTSIVDPEAAPGMPTYAQGDLRIVSVLFLDLQGFTAMSEKMAPDEVARIMSRCFEQLAGVVARFNGYVAQYIGDAMVVLFGAPVARADDPERAVRAAIALQAKLQQLSEELRRTAKITLNMRVGINTGEVLAGRVGAGEAGQFTVTGDTVNLAARLETASRVGHILVGETTYQLTRNVFRYTALPPITVKGKQEPVQTYEVVDIRDADTGDLSAASIFVGRERELALVGDLITNPRDEIQSVSIVGEAGYGKSRLITELHRRHQADARWIILHSAESDQQTPYVALRRLTDELIRQSGWVTDPGSRRENLSSGQPSGQIASLLSEGTDLTRTRAPHELRRSLTAALTRLVGLQGARQCLVIALDAAQWIDAESLAVLDEVVPMLADARVVLIEAALPEWQHPSPTDVHRLRLERFSSAECAEVISLLLRSREIDSAAVQTLAQQSGGNPLLLEEMVRAGLEGGTLCEIDGRWQLTAGAHRSASMPTSLRAIVQARLDQLSVDERAVLQVAAVVGQNWTASLLGQVLQESLPIPDLLRHLAEREFLTEEVGGEEPTYDFAHGVTQEVAYASLPHRKRQVLHERVGLALERRFNPAQSSRTSLRKIAGHFAEGRSRDRAARYLMYAADAAAALSADDVAVTQYRTALKYAEDITNVAERRALELDIHERLGNLLVLQSNLVEAQVVLEYAFELAGASVRGADLRAQLALVAARRGNHRHALELLKLTLSRTDLRTSARASAEARAALSLSSLGDLPEAEERALQARLLAEDAHDDRARELAQAALAVVRHHSGDLAGARAALESDDRDPAQESSRAAADEDRDVALAQTSYALADLGMTAEALHRALRAVPGASSRELPTDSELAEGVAGVGRDPRDTWGFASGETLFGQVLVGRGLLERGLSHFRDAIARAERIGAREVALQARARYAQASLESGRPQEAAETARAVIASAQSLELQPLICEAETVLSAALLELNQPEEASDLARRAVVRSRLLGIRLHEASARCMLGLALVRTDGWAQGWAQLDGAASAFESMGARLHWANTLLAAANAACIHAPASSRERIRSRLAGVLEIADTLRSEPYRAETIRLSAALSA